MKKGLKTFGAILGLFLVMPMWFFMLHEILKAINADRLLWFIYWTYIPVSLIIKIALEIADNSSD